MSNITDLVKYKQAKIIKKDLDSIIPLLDNTIKQLTRYKDRYSLVRNCMDSLSDAKTMLEIHKLNINKIIDNKAIIVDNKNNE